MRAVFTKVGTLTEKGQVTIPKSVREALGVGDGGRIAFVVDENRQVTLRREGEDADEDPVIAGFLSFLAEDMARHPERLGDISPALSARMAALSDGVPVSPDEPIVGAVDL